MDVRFVVCTRDNYKITPTTDIVKGFTSVRDNTGEHFDPTTGKFTAPVKGMYSFGLKHDDSLLIEASFDVVHECAGDGGSRVQKCVGSAHFKSYLGKASSSVNDTVWMEEMDALFVRVSGLYSGDFTLLHPSTFHCYLIGAAPVLVDDSAGDWTMVH